MTVRAVRTLPRLADDRRGIAALEFALVLGPFLLLLFFMIELGCMLVADVVIGNASVGLAQAYRRSETAPADLAQARAFVCTKFASFLDCDGKMKIDIRPVGDIDDISNKVIGSNGFKAGKDGDLLVVRIGYAWQGLTPVHRLANLGTSAGGQLVSGSFVRRAGKS
ncbi:MAG: pilus assembly protein [Geminicoccaceae bacterium]|nr:pilus assembly protein [Geminicoccaceae bacterium]MCB9943134.1 pilus assembly protein [Geminicoccaceae bacterium]